MRLRYLTSAVPCSIACAVGSVCFIASAEEKGGAGAPRGSLAKLAVDGKPLSLLDDRLSVRVPAGGKVEQRAHGIMAAPHSTEEETRVVVDAGQERLVLMAYEVFALAGDDLEKAVRADVTESWGEEAATVKIEKVDVAAPLKAVAIVPPIGDGTEEANLVLGMYVGHGDGTVQSLTFYVNPSGAKDADGALAVARRIAATVTSGSRKLKRTAGSRSFPETGADRLTVTVPEGFVASAQKGEDFAVYRLRKLMPLGQPTPSCTIYEGGHPAYRYLRADSPPDKVSTTKGKLLGRDVEWKAWTEADSITNEVMVKHPKFDAITVHVICSAETPEAMKEVRAIAETLRVEAARK